MIANYLKIAWRNIRRNMSYTVLNVAGLTLSIASCIVIFLIVKNELTYDRYHKKADRTYRVTLNAIDFNPSVSMAVTKAMRADFPELEHVAQFWYITSAQLQLGESRFIEEGSAFADEQFLRVFDFDWLDGDRNTALSAPNSIVLTKTLAKKYFGDKPAIGQIIRFDNSNDLQVTGVIDDLPGNTHLPFKYLVSFQTIIKEMEEGPMKHFYWINGANTYIVLPENYKVEQLQKQIFGFVKKNWGENIAKEARLPLQPLKDIHFDQRYLNNAAMPTTSRNTYIALAVVALFIIITACINFINLATALAMKRVKEVGIRKTLGAQRSQLIRQFLGETSLLVVLAVTLGITAAYFCLPAVATWLDIRIGVQALGETDTVMGLAGLTLLIILLAGLYPAFVQSAYRPAISLKSVSTSFRGLTLRKSLVFFQFAISQVLIVGTLIVGQQMDFFRNKDLGFNKEAVININLPDITKRDIVAQHLRSDPGVKDFSFSSGAPVGQGRFSPFSAPHLGLRETDVTEIKFIDTHYLRMFDIKLLAGENVKIRAIKDSPIVALVNETLIKKLNIKKPQDALGQLFLVDRDEMIIGGVVQDFQSESKHKARRPMVMGYHERAHFSANIKLQAGNYKETITRIEKIWPVHFPKDLFTYEFLDDRIASMYRQEQKAYTAFRMFSVLAIIIGCLGLYGLVAFAGVQRTKEVGIRKVLGASIPDIVMLFAKEFMLLIAIAFVIAAPLAWYIMNNWLDNFAYRVDIGFFTFLVAIASSFIIAAITIAHQSLKAALVNPVKSLRTE